MLRFFLLLLSIALGAAGYLWVDYNNAIESPMAVSESQRVFTVERGWSAKRIANELADQGMIEKPHWFELYSRISKKATAIKSGEFVIAGEPTIREFVDILVKGQTRQYSGRIIEGLTFKQIRENISANGDLLQTNSNMTASEIMARLGKPDLHPEGQFFSDTYSFPKGTTDMEFLQRAHAELNRVLEQEWANRAADLPLATPYEALILASIVEKETAVAAERPLIAGVFLSRIIKKMRLQTDPTVIYGIGDKYDGNIRRSDLRTDTPYNTYTRGGLPPTPISMVGREAIHAVLHPTATRSLYFVARGDGTHQFSETNEQHNAAVRKYQLKR